MRELLLTVVLPAAVLVAIFLVLANHYLREDDDYQGETEPARPTHARHSAVSDGRYQGPRRTGPAYPDPDYQDYAGWRTGDSDRLGIVPPQLAAAAARAQHLSERRHYAALEPDALEPCDLCGRVGLHTFSEWAREHSAWMAQQVAEAAWFAGTHGLDTAWVGNYELAETAA